MKEVGRLAKPAQRIRSSLSKSKISISEMLSKTKTKRRHGQKRNIWGQSGRWAHDQGSFRLMNCSGCCFASLLHGSCLRPCSAVSPESWKEYNNGQAQTVIFLMQRNTAEKPNSDILWQSSQYQTMPFKDKGAVEETPDSRKWSSDLWIP